MLKDMVTVCVECWNCRGEKLRHDDGANGMGIHEMGTAEGLDPEHRLNAQPGWDCTNVFVTTAF